MEEKLNSKINNLLDEYKNNTEVLEKLENFICHQLPNYLRNHNNILIERDNRKKSLEKQSEIFTENFLNTCNYYYNSSTEIFFHYKECNFKCIREDNVIYDILNSITKDKHLLPWKYKIKNTILKKIKERDILACIPESETIQKILNDIEQLCRFDKEQGKYFLTIVGDILSKKKTLNYFINPKLKKFIKEIGDNSCMLLGITNFCSNFKYKYHDHKYEDSLLIPFHGIMSEDFICNYFKHSIINFIVVSCYFSKRYNNAEHFINEYCKNQDLKKYVLYSKNNNEEAMVHKFITKMIETSNDSESMGWKEQITWKDITYLWKYYNESSGYPTFMYLADFKKIVKQQLINFYDGDMDLFLHITSHYLPEVRIFSEFWNTYFINTDDENEYEIDEVYNLLQSYKKTPSISEDNLLELIKYYYPDVDIEDNKYILNVSTSLWDKKKEMDYFLLNKDTISTSTEDLYNEYIKQTPNSKKRISKRYFAKFVNEKNELLSEIF